MNAPHGGAVDGDFSGGVIECQDGHCYSLGFFRQLHKFKNGHICHMKG